MATPADPRSLLPLTPLAYQVLLALVDDDLHGYGVIREVDRRTDGDVKILTGTLYTLVQRLLDEGLIQNAARGAKSEDDDRRKYYRLSDFGREVLVAETRRMESLIHQARRKRVLSRTSRG